MKIFASSLLLFLVVTPLLADHGQHPAKTRISDFIAGGGGTSIIPVLPQSGRDLSVPTIGVSNGSFSFDAEHQDNFQSFTDFSSIFAQLSAGLSDHHFDPQSLNDLQTFINNLHVDPALLEKLQMFVQNFHDGQFHTGDNNMDSDSNDDPEDMDDQGEDENGDRDEDDIPVAVPEPSTFAMIMAGAALLGGTLLRRRVR